MTLNDRIAEISAQNPKGILVPKRLFKPHVTVLRAKAYLDKQKASRWRGFEDSINTTSDYLSISVTKGNVSRALRVLDTLLKVLERRGHKITISHRGTTINIKGEEILIACREKCNRKKMNSDSWGSTDLVPNGKLSIKIVKAYCSKEWVDGYDLLEEKIAQIVAGLELRADDAIAQEARWEIQRQEQARLQAIRDREMAIADFEKEKVNILLKHTANWHRAQQIHTFLGSLKQEMPESEKAQNWLLWATEQANLFNPLSKGAESMLEMYEYQE